MITWISLAALVAVVFLGWSLYRRFGADRMAEIIERHRTTSRMVSRAELVEGNRHVDVVMAMTTSTLHYENADMQASLDLQWIHEIEYDNELSTGQAVENGKVLRLRSNSRVVEFVLPQDVVARWHVMLPPRRPIEAPVAPVGTGLTPAVANAS